MYVQIEQLIRDIYCDTFVTQQFYLLKTPPSLIEGDYLGRV